MVYYVNMTNQKLTNMEAISQEIPALTVQMEKHKVLVKFSELSLDEQRCDLLKRIF